MISITGEADHSEEHFIGIAEVGGFESHPVHSFFSIQTPLSPDGLLIRTIGSNHSVFLLDSQVIVCATILIIIHYTYNVVIE